MKIFISFLLFFILLLFSANSFSQQKEEYDYKYTFHSKGLYYIHGELVAPETYQRYALKCDSVLKARHKQLSLLQGVYFEEMPSKPTLNMDGEVLNLKTSNSSKNTSLLIYRINISVDQLRRAVYISASQAIDKPNMDLFAVSLNKYKIVNCGTYVYYWVDPDRKLTKIDLTFNSRLFKASYDTAVDFNKYKTFAWLTDTSDTKNLLNANPVMTREIQTNFNKLLGLRGMGCSSDHPDLLIQVILNKKRNTEVEMSRNSKSINKAVTGASPGIGGGSGGRRGGGGSKGGVETSTSWDRDTNVTFSRNFSFKIIDRKLNKVVWACYLNLEPNLNGVLYSEDVNRSVLRNILESYPAKTVASSEIVKRTAICTVRDSPEAVREFLFQYQFSYDMGGFRSVSIRKDTAYIETKMGMSPLGATSRKTFVSPSDWKNLTGAIAAYKYSELVDLPSPTRLRDSEGAYKSSLEIKTNKSSYSCGYFDGYDPNAKLKKLIDVIKEIEKR